MVTTKQKPILDTQKIKRKESNHTTKGSHQIIKEREREEERKREELQKSQKTINKMAVSAYLSTTALNINRLNSPVKRYRMVEWIKKKQDPSILCL